MAASCEMGIPKFFAEKHVFVTGATGFMGKVLVERLLTTCPDVARIFLLMRSKKDQEPEQRLQGLKASKAFENVRRSRPSQLDKLSIITGDIMLPGLGISSDDIDKLRDVSVVFHSAATVKFDEALKIAIDKNVMSVIGLLEICDRLPKMQAFVHVSTAYCNAELSTVEERVYPPPVPLDHLLDLAAKNSPELDDVDRFISPKPNTYTFTKAMAESAVQQHGCRSYPIAIVRPTIVISSLTHPFPGWLENVNGPSGVIAGAGRGLLRVFKSRQSAIADLLPVDIAIDILLAAAWETAIDKPPTPIVYNCSINENPTTWGDVQRAINLYTRSQPQSGVMWYPQLKLVENGFIYKILKTVLQTIPLYLGEAVTRLVGYKKRVNFIRVSKQLNHMQAVTEFFTLREWTFSTGNLQKLRQRLCEADQRVLNLEPKTIDWNEHFKNYVNGVRLYVLNDKDQDQPDAKKRLKRLYYLHCGLSIFLPALLLRLFVRKRHWQNIYKTIFFLFSMLNAICESSKTLLPLSIRS